ncbi:hypothetical protein L195_g027079 [Trifolium pratense]|uniref:Uncharacterized protein n=1 Tax=Trifolium pratense TaxID=57577 RepID=A0A2K3KY47_TRIPR|nr:hypothetical protein L195_g027079 [Trifolium pratense]
MSDTPLRMQKTTPMTVDPMEEKIAKYRSIDRKLIIDERFRDLPDIASLSDIYFKGTCKAPLFDFPDDSWLHEPGYQLPRIGTAELATLGRYVIPMLSSGLSEKAIGILFVLAYNLRRPTKGSVEYVFSDHELGLGSLEDMNVSDLSDNLLIRVREPFYVAATTDLDREAMYYSFIAASTFRLFTKSPENYLRAFTHICNMFPKFYGVSCPVRLPTPHIDALKILKANFSIHPICKVTLYRVLYLSGGGEENEEILSEMKRFLYDEHLAYTGLHAVRIFMKLCQALNCNTELLLAILNIREYERQINAMIKMVGIITSPLEKHKRKMWRYGRLFDDAFMSPLRTRTCPALTYTLASALKKVSSQSNERILDIVQLGDVSEEKRRSLDVVAENIIRTVRCNAKGSQNNPCSTLHMSV